MHDRHLIDLFRMAILEMQSHSLIYIAFLF